MAADYPDLLEIVRRLVKPERDQNNRPVYRDKWWHFAEKRPALYHAIGHGRAFARHPEGWTEGVATARVFVRLITSKHHTFSAVDASQTIDQTLNVFAFDDFAQFALLCSEVHVGWWYKQGATFGASRYPRYIQSDVYQTFPYPAQFEPLRNDFAALGRAIESQRTLITSASRTGLTSIYNEVHRPTSSLVGVDALRELHRQIDVLVTRAYGWDDITLEHGFYDVSYLPAADCTRFTIAEAARQEVIRRLSSLNKQRYQAEQEAAQSLEAARAERAVPRKRAGRPDAKRAATTATQPQLFE